MEGGDEMHPIDREGERESETDSLTLDSSERHSFDSLTSYRLDVRGTPRVITTKKKKV